MLSSSFLHVAAFHPSARSRRSSRLVVPAALKSRKSTSAWSYSKSLQQQQQQHQLLQQQELSMEEMVGKPMPMSKIPVGMLIQGIEVNVGQGGKLGRARGSFARIVRKKAEPPRVAVRLPSGAEKVLDARCFALVGPLHNPKYVKPKLYKAGQNRWKGIRPKVRGVAKNPVDLPRGGRVNQSRPWGRGIKHVRKTPPWALHE